MMAWAHVHPSLLTKLSARSPNVAGSDWLLPEFSVLAGATVSTLGQLMQNEHQIERKERLARERAMTGQVCKVLSDELFSSSAGRPGIITRIVRATAERAKEGWVEEICGKLRKRMRESHAGREGRALGWSEEEWFRAGGERDRERCADAKATLETYVSALAAELSQAFGTGGAGMRAAAAAEPPTTDLAHRPGPPAWATLASGEAWRPLVAMAHGDLHASNVLIDLRGSAWLIDFGEVSTGKLVVADLARLLAALLYEQTPIDSFSELEAACAMVESLFRFPRADVREPATAPDVDDARFPRLGAACDAAMRFLQALPGVLSAAADGARERNKGGVECADFHPTCFQLTMLERCLRLLTYLPEDLSTWQRQWALHSAAVLAKELYTALEAHPSAEADAHEVGSSLSASRVRSFRSTPNAIAIYRGFVEGSVVFDEVTGMRLDFEEHCADIACVDEEGDRLQCGALLARLLAPLEPAPSAATIDLAHPEEPRFLMTGVTGCGKTMLLRRLAYACSKWHLRTECDIVPLFIEGGDLVRVMGAQPESTCSSPTRLLCAYIRQRYDGARYQLLLSALKGRRLLVLLDGAAGAAKGVERFAANYRGRIVLSLRPSGFSELSFRQFVRLHVEPLSEAQIRSVVCTRASDPQYALSFVEQLELSSNPKMLSMLIAMLEVGVAQERSLVNIFKCCSRMLLLRLDDDGREQALLQRAVYRWGRRRAASGLACSYECLLTSELVEQAISSFSDVEERRRDWQRLEEKASAGLVPGIMLRHLDEGLSMSFVNDALVQCLFVDELLQVLEGCSASGEVVAELGSVLPQWSRLVRERWWDSVLQLGIEQRASFTDEVMATIVASPAASRDGAAEAVDSRGGALLFANLLRREKLDGVEWLRAHGIGLNETLQRALLDDHMGETAWHEAVKGESTKDVVAELVKKLPTLRSAPDREGRAVEGMAARGVREAIENALTFCGAVEITSAVPEQVSMASVTLFGRAAREVKLKSAWGDDEQQLCKGEGLAIKLMANELEYRNEVEHRKGALGRGDAVVPIVWTSEDLKARWDTDVADLDFGEGKRFGGYKYGIVMPLAQRNLMMIMLQELRAHEVPAKVLRSLAGCLGVMHANKKVHTDFKPVNAVRMADYSYRLINLDLAASTGDPLTREGLSQRLSSAYSPPEVLRMLHGHGGPVDASASLDMWSFGVVMFRILTQKALFESDDNDNIVGKAVLKQAFEWSAESLGEAIRDADYAMLHRDEQQRAASGGHDKRSVVRAQRRRVAALDLLSWLLEENPEQRPMMFDVQRHAFFEENEKLALSAAWRMGPLHVAAALGERKAVERLLREKKVRLEEQPAPQITTEGELDEWLRDHGAYARSEGREGREGGGVGGIVLESGMLEGLLREFTERRCELSHQKAEDGAKSVLRRVRTVSVVVQCEWQGQSHALIAETEEANEVEADGLTGTQGATCSTTLLLGEAWDRAALRACSELLQSVGLDGREAERVFKLAEDISEHTSAPEASAAYVGLTTIHSSLRVEARLYVDKLGGTESKSQLGIESGRLSTLTAGGRRLSWRAAPPSLPGGFANEAALVAWLSKYGVSSGRFRKSSRHLLGELRSGASSLVAEEQERGGIAVVRRVTTVQLTVQHEGYILIEKRIIENRVPQVLGRDNGGNGREPITKLLPGELWSDAASRWFKETLNLTPAYYQLDEKVSQLRETIDSESYSGIVTQYMAYHVSAQLRNRAKLRELSVEAQRSIGLGDNRPEDFVRDERRMRGGVERLTRHCWSWEEVGQWERITKRSSVRQQEHPLGYSPLHLAAMEGHHRVVDELVRDPSIDVNAVSHAGETALHTVLTRIEQAPPNTAYAGALLDTCERLANRANPTVVDRTGITAWQLAAASSVPDVRRIMKQKIFEARLLQSIEQLEQFDLVSFSDFWRHSPPDQQEILFLRVLAACGRLLSPPLDAMKSGYLRSYIFPLPIWVDKTNFARLRHLAGSKEQEVMSSMRRLLHQMGNVSEAGRMAMDEVSIDNTVDVSDPLDDGSLSPLVQLTRTPQLPQAQATFVARLREVLLPAEDVLFSSQAASEAARSFMHDQCPRTVFLRTIADDAPPMAFKLGDGENLRDCWSRLEQHSATLRCVLDSNILVILNIH